MVNVWPLTAVFAGVWVRRDDLQYHGKWSSKRTANHIITKQVRAWVRICHSGREKTRAPNFTATHKTSVQVSAPNTTAAAMIRERWMLPAPIDWLPTTASQNPRF